ncbi:hypothetical protein WBP07_17290 [Novosphingobium sp. BL-8A]
MFLLFAIGVLAWTFLFPALNWPDEIYKVSRVGIDENIYLDLLSRATTNYCIVSYVNGSDMSYLSNVFHARMTGGYECYYDMKLVNAAMILISALLGVFLLKDSNYKNLYLMSLIWPANLFYMTGINQQALFCTLSVLVMVGALASKRIWPYTIASIALVLIDRSFVSLTIYLGCLMGFRWRPQIALGMMIVLLVVAIVIRPYVEASNIFVGGDSTIGDISQSLTDYYDNPIVSLGLLFVSFVYLGGTNAILGIGVDYLLVILVGGKWLWKERMNEDMKSYLYAFIFTYFLVISFVPTIQTFRYYVFLLPILIKYLCNSRDNQNKYCFYAIVMNVVYLVQATIIYG